MTLDKLKEACLALPGAWLCNPWAEDIVAKVGPRIFAYLGEEARPSVTLKCAPLEGDLLHARYPCITPPPAYLRRDLYVRVPLNEGVPDELILALLEQSYRLIYHNLTRAQKRAVEDGAHEQPRRANKGP